ncbi:MAG: cytochrome P460 family protein [Halofilum sp. (in: g-proteobacteria)]
MRRKILTATAVTGLLGACAAVAEKPFGGPESVDYSQELWTALEEANLAGPDSINSVAYEGQHPHGAVLETLDSTVTVDGHSGDVIVKRNYGGEGVSESKVANNPEEWLAAVTVMFRREEGYDPDNDNWFWAKYLPDGSLDTNPKGMELAGRVAKGMDQGCIACHQNAPGGDYVFNNDRY